MRSRYLVGMIFLAISRLAVAQQATSSLDFTSSMPSLTQSFKWAKSQALAYTRPGSKTIGPWYEAALPGRNAFCMRDVSHQTEGAAALGLSAANKNMLKLFAQSAAESRDWAAYWEIDGEGRPSVADYVSDTDFWFNLPANFDVLDASVRQWRWTGDNSYRDDPAFQRFFRITVTDYMKRWQLEPATILKRPRIANQHQAEGRFVQSRGIPSYTEESKDFIFGADLLAAEYRALRSFEEIDNAHEKELRSQMLQNADAIQSLLERVAWSEKDHHYLGTIRKDLTGYGSGDVLVLYFGAAKDPVHIRGALDYLSSPTYWRHIGIEEESYVPLTLFRYGRSEAGYQIIADLSDPQKERREYPEVSYAVVAAVVGGVMGISPGMKDDGFDIRTLSSLPTEKDEATLTNIPIKQNQIDVMHKGTSMTRLKNTSGASLYWRAEFPGTFTYLNVNGKNVSAKHSMSEGNTAISWIDVTVPAGANSVVSK